VATSPSSFITPEQALAVLQTGGVGAETFQKTRTSQKEIEQINKLLQEGNVRGAYAVFEELPAGEQFRISMSPGIGDTLAGYEVYEFTERAKEKAKSGSGLSAAGYAALAGLSVVSLIPLFRFLRASRVVNKNIKTEPLQLPSPKKEEPEIAKAIEEINSPPKMTPKDFVPVPRSELMYEGGVFSPVREYLNYGKKTPFEKPLNAWVKTILKGTQKDLGELRLLGLVDDGGNLTLEAIRRFGGENVKVNRKALDNFLAQNQKDALQVKEISEGLFRSSGANVKDNTNRDFFSNGESQRAYTIRGLDRRYSGPLSHGHDHYDRLGFEDPVYVFDGATVVDLDPNLIDYVRSSLTRQNILSPDQNPESTIRSFAPDGETKNYLNLSRIQSDYSQQLGNAQRRADGQPVMIDETKIDIPSDILEARKQFNNSVDIFNKLMGRKKKLLDEADKLFREGDTIGADNLKTQALLIEDEILAEQKKMSPLLNKVNEFNRVPAVTRNDGVVDTPKVDIDYKTPKKSAFFDFKDELSDYLQTERSRYPAIRYDAPEGERLRDRLAEDPTGPFSSVSNIAEISSLTDRIRPSVDPEIAQLQKNITILKRAGDLRLKQSDLLKKDPYFSGTRVNPTTDQHKLPTRVRIKQAIDMGLDGIFIDTPATRLGREGGEQYPILNNIYRQSVKDLIDLVKFYKQKGYNVDSKDVVGIGTPYDIGELLSDGTPDFETFYGDAYKYPFGIDELSKLKISTIQEGGPGRIEPGTYMPFSDEFKKAVEEVGIPAFAKGGHVEIPLPKI
tara:strand:+ start:1770 stop:4133 length:2364 start_codon:yes stop_codon:yes gene_type:complete